MIIYSVVSASAGKLSDSANMDFCARAISVLNLAEKRNEHVSMIEAWSILLEANLRQ